MSVLLSLVVRLRALAGSPTRGLVALAIAALAPACAAGDSADPSAAASGPASGPSATSGGGQGGGGDGGGFTTSSSTAGGQGGEGGQGAGGGAVVASAPGTETVSAGQRASSQTYRMVFTFGQPTQNQGKTTSQSYRMQGGLVGSNGSLP